MSAGDGSDNMNRQDEIAPPMPLTPVLVPAPRSLPVERTTPTAPDLTGGEAATAEPAALGKRLRSLWQRLREGGALMVGVPDYDRYCVHMQEHHPELLPLTREAFVQGRMLARYGGKGVAKCPC